MQIHAIAAGLGTPVLIRPVIDAFSGSGTPALTQRKTAGAFGGHTGGGYQKATAEVCHSRANSASTGRAAR